MNTALVRKLALISIKVAAGACRCPWISLLVVDSTSQPVLGCPGRRAGRPGQGGPIAAARRQPRTGSHCRRLHLERQSIPLLLMLRRHHKLTLATHYFHSTTSGDVTRSNPFTDYLIRNVSKSVRARQIRSVLYDAA